MQNRPGVDEDQRDALLARPLRDDLDLLDLGRSGRHNDDGVIVVANGSVSESLKSNNLCGGSQAAVSKMPKTSHTHT